MALKYNSGINIMGSILDYSSMIDYIIEEYTGGSSNGSFKFRTSKSLKRFIAGIEDSVLSFKDDEHKKLFFDGISSIDLSTNDKLMLIFWQMIYANTLFHDISSEVLMKAVYQGRSTLSQDDIYSYIRHLKDEYPDELNWSEATLKIIGSKYLTAIKKLGLADGSLRKEIRYPLIGDALFVYFIRWCLCVYPTDRSLNNPYMVFGFCDHTTLISRLKKIDLIQYWDITQIGNDITIDLKPYE